MKIKVADFVINYLADKGIKDIFVVYGAANGDLIDAFTRTDKTRYVCTMHEQAGGFAAEGYAKISGKPGVAIATSGPGGQNFLTPIGNCFYDSVPALFITGQVDSKFLRTDPSIRQLGFQETDISGIISPITKYARLIKEPESIKYELEKAWFLSQDGRPGPVLLDMPIDVQKTKVDLESLVGFDSTLQESSYNTNLINQKIKNYLSDLSSSKRPAIIVGGGVRTAKGIEELLELARKLKIPCFPTWNALDIVTSDFEYYGGRVGSYGDRGGNLGIQNSDLILAIGSRISGRITGSNVGSFLREAKKYLVNIDEPLLQKKLQPVQFDENILCDAKLFLNLINRQVNSSDFNFSEWTGKVIEWRDKYDSVKPEYFEQKSPTNPYAFMRILSEEMKQRDIFIADCGGNIVVSSQAFETKKGQRFLTNNGNSPMGFSFSGAMGAYLASDKNQNTVCIIGDGGFNMNIQELQTVKNYNLGFKTFILNNHCYGITRQFQRTRFNGREEACGPKGYNPPDFIKICDAYGIPNLTINNNSEAREKIKKVLDHKGAIVCDVNCHDWDTYEPRVFGGKPIEDMFPLLPREEFKGNMIIRPLED